MRIVLLSLSLPLLLLACECDDEAKERDKERKEDAYYHGCRSCRHSPFIHSEACPHFGFDCDTAWRFTVNVLTPSDSCRCAEARCEGTSQMAFDNRIVHKLRCNNSIWIVGDKEAKAVVCAKSCNAGVCKASNPRASADFKTLKVTAADNNNRCATGTCDYGLASIDDDGSLIAPLDGVTSVFCSSDGVWLNGDEMHKYVMCNASPCGPTRCPSLVPGNALNNGLAFPLTITGNGQECATATCKNGFILMTPSGDTNGVLEDTKITCQKDGTWMDSKQVSHEHVMCAPSGELPCPSPPNWDGHPLTDEKTVYSDLAGPTYQNGNKVYKCDFTMISSDSKPVEEGSILVCRPDTGLFVLKNGANERVVSSRDAYACSEKACPPVSQFEDSQVTLPPEFTEGGNIMTETQGDGKVANCPLGSALYDFLNPPTPEVVAPGKIPSCKRGSGLWMPDEGAKYRCLKKKCDPATVATTNVEYCPVTKCDQTKVTKTESDVKCASPFEVSFQESATGTPKRVKTLTCDSATGKWKTDAGDSVDKVFVTCAPESCDIGVCKSTLPNAPGEYTPIDVKPANAQEPCAFAVCPNGYVSLSQDGSVKRTFQSASIKCGSDGNWRGGDGQPNEYVMCVKEKGCEKVTEDIAFCETKSDGTPCLPVDQNAKELKCPKNYQLFVGNTLTMLGNGYDVINCINGEWMVDVDGVNKKPLKELGDVVACWLKL